MDHAEAAMNGRVVLRAKVQMKKLGHPLMLYSPFRNAPRICEVCLT